MQSFLPAQEIASSPDKSQKKKYSKVNEALKKEFLSLIIQQNRSIKYASQLLNINYSSAKAILASHRKQLHSQRKINKDAPQVQYRTLTAIDHFRAEFSVICSTGGLETSSFDQFSQKNPVFVSSLAPIILVQTEKDLDWSQNTENQNCQ